MTVIATRRRFLATLALTGTAGILPPRRAWAAEAALETTTVRLGRIPFICFAPQYVCEALLRAEGFTDVRYVDTNVQTSEEELGAGRFDFQSNGATAYPIAIDRGLPITVLTGVHAGCYELFVHGGIRGIADLKGKKIGYLGGPEQISMMAVYVGLDPKKDFTLVGDPAAKPMELFAEGKLDAYLAFPPEVQELHARKVGHVILRTAVDRPGRSISAV
jgi:NitT/TauT family transport system substrate-binding protein